jgi:hypothetical protein
VQDMSSRLWAAEDVRLLHVLSPLLQRVDTVSEILVAGTKMRRE